MPLTIHRLGVRPVVAAISLLPITLCYTGCRGQQLDADSDPELASQYGVPKYHFEYCELKPVEQKIDPTGGLASLASVIDYWEIESTEAKLAETYPLPDSGTSSVRKLRRIAMDEGLTAFALAMKQSPIEQLGEELNNGRPVIVSLVLEGQGYPGLEEQTAKLSGKRFGVVFGQSDAEFLLLEPGYGVLRIPKKSFETVWAAGKYGALICSAP